MSRKIITPAQAIELLNDGDYIHVFRNPNGMLLGADWSRQSIIDEINKDGAVLEIGGQQCRAMGHGLVINLSAFVEANEEKIKLLDKSESNPSRECQSGE